VTEHSDKAEKTFDPSRYLTRLPKRARQADGSWKTVETDYLEVKWRLLWLRTDHPDASIETEMVSYADETAIFKARVAVPGGGSATGWGHETAADFGDFLEKAETKALGRALSALGYGTQFCEDFDFEQAPSRVGEAARVVDAPIDRGTVRAFRGPEQAANVTSIRGSGVDGSRDAGEAARRAQSSGADRSVPLATEPQVKAIYAIARGTLALDDEELDNRCRERYGCAPAALTRRQASEFIDALKLSVAGHAS
jgi:hypothetical protein